MTESKIDLAEKSFHGVLWPPFVNQEAIDGVSNLDIRDDDIMVITFPKSGTHWVQEIVSLIHVNGDIEQINREETCGLLESFKEDSLDVLTSGVDQKRPAYMRVKSWKSPRVLISHTLEDLFPKQLKQGKGKVIYVIRNPKDVAVSYWHFLKKRRNEGVYTEWSTYIDKFIEGTATYGPWYKHVKEYWKRHKDSANFLFIHYEDLKKDHRGGINKIANFIGRSLSEDAIDKIMEHSSLEGMSRTYHTANESLPSLQQNASTCHKKIGAVDLIRKGIVGDWKTRFTVSQNEEFDSVFKNELEGTGINVDYE